MDSTIVMLKLFLLPRSRIILGLCIAVLISGSALSPLVNMIAKDSQPWVAQQTAVWILLILGLSLGNTLRRIRAWSPALLVPGLLKKHARVALVLVTLFWVFYVAPMIATDTLAGYPASLSLLAGVLAILTGTGIDRRANAAWILLIPVTLVDECQDFAFTLLAHPAAEPAVLILTGLVGAMLLQRFPEMSGDVTASSDINVKLPSHIRVSRLVFSRIPAAMSAAGAFQATFSNTGQQAWRATAIVFLLVNLLSLGLFALAGGETSNFVILSAAICGICAVSAPLTYRFLFDNSREFLWLAAGFPTRQQQTRASLLAMQRPLIRLCALNALLLLLLGGTTPNVTVLGVALTIMALAPAGGVMMVSTMMVLVPREQGWQSGQEFVFGILMLIEMLALMSVAVLLPVSLGMYGGVLAGLVVAVCITFAATHAASLLLERRLWRG